MLLHILILAGLLALIEAILRIHHKLNRKKLYYKEIRMRHDLLGWVHIPNLSVRIKGKEWSVVLKTNSLGFRDIEHSIKKPKSTIRILFLGDSYVAAIRIPYDKTFHQVMKSELERRLNINVETINLAVGGWTTANEYLAFKEIGIKYEPDIVILVLYIHNDIYENSLKLKGGGPWCWPVFELQEGVLRLVPKDKALNFRKINKKSLLEKILGHFILCRIVYRRLFKKGKYPGFFNIYLKEYSDEWLEAFVITEKLIEKIYELAKSINAYFLIVLAPSPWQVEPKRWLEMLKKYPSMKKKEWDLEHPDKLLIKFLEGRGIDYIWLLPYLKQVTKEGKELYFKSIDHWNTLGEHVVGLILTEKLENIIKYRKQIHQRRKT